MLWTFYRCDFSGTINFKTLSDEVDRFLPLTVITNTSITTSRATD